MEARSFFENSPMAEITVSATKEEWQDVITFMTNCPYWPPVSVPAIEFVDQLEERGVEAH